MGETTPRSDSTYASHQSGSGRARSGSTAAGSGPLVLRAAITDVEGRGFDGPAVMLLLVVKAHEEPRGQCPPGGSLHPAGHSTCRQVRGWEPRQWFLYSASGRSGCNQVGLHCSAFDSQTTGFSSSTIPVYSQQPASRLLGRLCLSALIIYSCRVFYGTIITGLPSSSLNHTPLWGKIKDTTVRPMNSISTPPTVSTQRSVQDEVLGA